MINIEQITDKRLADNVLIGKDGYIFLRNDRNNTQAQISGKKTLKNAELKSWHRLLEMRRIWFKMHGITYIFVAAPCKECVYENYLPEELFVSDNRPVGRLIKYLKKWPDHKIVYPLEILKKSEKTTYPKGDSHWNWYGAFLAYQAIMSEAHSTLPNISLGRKKFLKAFLRKIRFKRKVLSINDIYFYDEDYESDLSSKIGISDIVTKAKIKKPKAVMIERNEVSNIGNYRVFENPDKNLPCAVLFRDSFSNYLMHFLAESFSRLVIVWQPNIDYGIVEKEKPDIVISQQAERFMVVIPDDINGPTNTEHVANKVKKGIVEKEQGERKQC